MYTEAPRASLLRRLSAIMYDLLVICAIWMFCHGAGACCRGIAGQKQV